MSTHRLIKGLVIRTVQVGDWNLYLHILSRDEGIVSCYARGARRRNSELAGLGRLYSLVELEVFQGRKSLSLDGGEVLYVFPSLAKDPMKFTAAGHAADITISVLRDPSLSAGVYALLNYYLFALDEGRRPPEQLMASYGYRLLCEAGFAPLLREDPATGAILTTERLNETRYYYHRGKAALVSAPEDGAPLLPMTATLRTALDYLRSAPPERIFRTEMNAPLVAQLADFVTKVLEDQLEEPMERLRLYYELKQLEAEAQQLRPQTRAAESAPEDGT